MSAALLVSHSHDAWARAVAAAVQKRGGTPILLLTDAYPAAFRIGFDADGCTLANDQGRSVLTSPVTVKPRILRNALEQICSGYSLSRYEYVT